MIATTPETYDVIIVGAGISGINFAYRLQENTPELSYAILENRDDIGGTWDLFRYPGIRSDSDLYTFAFKWNPWPEKKSIAEGHLILKYLKESAAMVGIDKHIKLKHHVDGANWSSEQQAWSLDVTANGSKREFRSRFLMFCTGYYDYHTPLQTTIPGIQNFGGKVVHPQFWPEDLDYTDKNVVIIGSGATAITILPVMAEKAAQVTMLQRSPSYVLSRPTEDKMEQLIRATAPSWMAPTLYRIKWLAIPYLFIFICKYLPNLAKRIVRRMMQRELPPTIPIDPHFSPSYNPWEQRLCVCPDGDFYAALRSGKGNIVTGHIKEVTKDAIKLTDGQELHPDIIVTATGLKIQVAGGMRITVDGQPYKVGEKFMWKKFMLQDLPNAFYVVGYVNASWTLGADVTALMTCRLIKEMKKKNAAVVVPRVPKNEDIGQRPIFELSSTYLRTAQDIMPKAGKKPQWAPRGTYMSDLWDARFGDIHTDLEYIKPNE